MNFKFWISEIRFSDGTIVPIEENDIVVMVGANNAGKSATLKEAASLLTQKHPHVKVVKDITIEKSGTEEDLKLFLEHSSRKSFSEGNSSFHYQGYGYNIYESNLKHFWINHTKGLSDLRPAFVSSLDAEERLSIANPVENINLISEPPRHPINFLQRDAALEEGFSNYFRQAFGTDLILHRNSGRMVPLYVGHKPVPKEGEDRLSLSYLEELEKLDPLHQQGDGMRSFVGVLLKAFISNHSILFIDEPEAFLHPPQARLLGKMLAKDLPSERQLFLATHSEDFLKGLLDAGVSNLKIIRIRRNGTVNTVSVLNNADINNVWKDSLLRHSNVLSGLFHSQVVICESDSDCRFFSAVLAALYDDTGSIAPDLLFIHCGGKHRIPTAIKALKKLDVPLNVIADFDVLNDIYPLKEIFEDLGGIWKDVESDWKLVKSEIERKRPELVTEDLKKEIEKVFHSTTDRIITKDKIAEIQKLLKKASAWSEAKENGKSFIPSGNATQAFERIQLKFNEKGLLILEVGELEGFVKTVGGHGPKWVSDVLEKDLKTDAELEPARQFVRQIVG